MIITIDSEYYMDAEYVAILADYTYDRISKTITINTVNKILIVISMTLRLVVLMI